MSAKNRKEVGRKIPASRLRRRATATSRARETAKKKSRTSEKKSVAGRDGAGRFKAGFSGNPNGSKIIVPEEVRTAALELSVEALMRLAHWMRSDDSQASIMSAKIILDRGLGKAIQPLLTNGSSLVNITMQGNGAIITAEDAAAVYKELCGDPSLDISGLRLAAPAPAQAVERQPLPSASDPLAPATETSRTLEMWEKLGK